MPAEPIIPSNKQESLQHPSTSAFCHKLLFHLWFFSSDGQNLSPWCWPLCSAAESSKYLSPEPAIPLLNQFQCTRTAEIGSHLLNGNSSLPLTLLLNTDDMGVGFKKVQKITKLRSWPDGPTWKLRFSTNLQFRKCRNCRIYLLLFRDRSNRKKSQRFGKKKKQLKTERVNTAKSSREQVPTDLFPVLSLEGFPLQLGPIAAGKTRGSTSAGKSFLTHHCRQILQPEPGQRAGSWAWGSACCPSSTPTWGVLQQAPFCTQTSTFPASCQGAFELHFFRRRTLFDGF